MLEINSEIESNKIVEFIKTTFAGQHKKIAIIGLSGGIDSAVAAALTVQSLGPENIHALLLPGSQSDPTHTQDAHLITSALKIPPQHIHQVPLAGIQSQFISTFNQISEYPQPVSGYRLGNITARLRMVCLFDFAKAVDGLVIGTENKSEHLLGYFTRFGDQASDLEPITHLFKTQIYQLAKYLKIPDPIITKPPTANLWANQTDEQELGFSYSQADPILSLYHDQHQTREQIISAGFNLELVDKVVRQSESSAFKLLVPYHL